MPGDEFAFLMRRLEPEIALELETTLLRVEAEQLEILTRIKKSKKRVSIEILMKDGLLLRISPIRRGSNDIPEWGTYLHNPFVKNKVEFLIHAHVQVIRRTAEGQQLLESFTSSARTLSSLIEQASKIFLSVTGDKITPIRRSEVSPSSGSILSRRKNDGQNP
jgi:hypothetical protein